MTNSYFSEPSLLVLVGRGFLDPSGRLLKVTVLLNSRGVGVLLFCFLMCSSHCVHKNTIILCNIFPFYWRAGVLYSVVLTNFPTKSESLKTYVTELHTTQLQCSEVPNLKIISVLSDRFL